ncbi:MULTISPECIES: ribosome maturation factor RimP [unclassified Clostridium]|jgi:ribosome maturation factor RimP|uniref:ribosome maturation factor RimP n=1 Tax=Clostridia TaxID=186801 RepID=UPI000821EB79|nr:MULTISPECIES: ribosome maturation factor RimP [unclassified Clostridium]SCJ15410.1 Ribosome maturation factor RimP [uncultured Clostridium sp.]
MPSKIESQIEGRVLPIAQEMKMDLVDVELRKEGQARFMRIFVDMPGGVDLDHCQEFHMRIRDLFDDIDYDYLEVSSPGDRPLKRDADFVRMAGSPVQVRLYKALDGQKAFEGELVGRTQEDVVILIDGKERRFDRKIVAAVKPVFEMI